MSAPSRLLGSILLCGLLATGCGTPADSFRPLWDGQTFEAFRLRVRYRAVRGNSGLYVRMPFSEVAIEELSD